MKAYTLNRIGYSSKICYKNYNSQKITERIKPDKYDCKIKN